MNNVIITQLKNQSERIYDWLFYHKNEGFDSFIIFDDFSEDDTINEINKFKEDYNANIILKNTDEKGHNYSLLESKNSESYAHDGALNDRIKRSYTAGNNIVKSINPNAVCCFIDVDEFLVTKENETTANVIRRIFNDNNCTQILVYNFDVKHDYKLEKNFIYKNDNYYRWDYDDVNKHPVWQTRCKSITISKSTTEVTFVHYINNIDYNTYHCRDYDMLKMLHFRIPNLPNSSDIGFVLDNTIKNKMLSNLKQ